MQFPSPGTFLTLKPCLVAIVSISDIFFYKKNQLFLALPTFLTTP
jgi:hypothetical protein